MIRLNGTQVIPTIFPDGTSQIWHLPESLYKNSKRQLITWEFSNESELIHLAQLKDLLSNCLINLDIKYLPYARQDKEISNDTTFALHSFAKLLNSLNFNKVTILDPHSKEALSLINNSIAVYPVESVMKIAYKLKIDLFCYPDNGAYTKYTGYPNVQNEIYDYPCIYGEKVREQSTGKILSYRLEGDCKDKKVLIVDDLADGGATFVLLANELYKASATEVNLFVTHGIFSKGLKPLLDAEIKRIFTKEGEAGEIQNNITYRRL